MRITQTRVGSFWGMVLACAAAMSAAAQTPSIEMMDRVLLLPGTSYVVMPQKQIGYGMIPPQTVTPSTNGRSIAFVATAPEALLNPKAPLIRGIYAHRVGSGRTSMMLRLNPNQEVGAMHWLGDRLVAKINREGVSELVLLGPGDNQFRNITSWSEMSIVAPAEEDPNPNQPAWPAGMVLTRWLGGTESVCYLMAQTSATTTELWAVNAGGQLQRQPVDLSQIQPEFAIVLPNGLIALRRQKGEREIFTCLNPVTGTLVQYEELPPKNEVRLEVDRPWYMNARQTKRGFGRNALVLGAFELEDPPTPAVVTENAVKGGVMPEKKAVWFVDSFGLYLCDLMPVDSEQLEALMKEAVKADAISRAKQVGTGMMIYGADYDDYLPRSGDWQSAVLPYLRDSDVMEGFIYMGNGENLSNIKDPGNEVLGYIETPYGRAIVRMDSSVKWEDKPKALALDRRWWDHRYQVARR
ncbi:MAG: hypothetical protein LCH41_04955 [Armatimonadetes bacterium]|nr:hypothetical protein [Armatimonadota bacterium]